jgi:hypothetical protein
MFKRDLQLPELSDKKSLELVPNLYQATRFRDSSLLRKYPEAQMQPDPEDEGVVPLGHACGQLTDFRALSAYVLTSFH